MELQYNLQILKTFVKRAFLQLPKYFSSQQALMMLSTNHTSATGQAPSQQATPQIFPYYPAVLSSSLAFPQFATEISESDDRVIALSTHLHRVLSTNLQLHNPTAGNSLEIEGKLGLISYRDAATNPIIAELSKQRAWNICLPQRVGQMSLYKFESNISSIIGAENSHLNESQIFTALQQYLSELSQKNPDHLRQSFSKTRDDFVKDGHNQVRLTYRASPDGQFEQQASEILFKKRLDDINIKQGIDGLHLKSDIRISTSLETQLPSTWRSSSPIEQRRFKDRFKYHFQHLVFDLTKTVTLDNSGIEKGSQYEVEVEIHDLKFLIDNLKNTQAFHHIIRRFLQNIASLANILTHIRSTINQRQGNPEQLMNAFKAESKAAYDEFYSVGGKKPPASIVGDYLSGVAQSQTKKNKKRKASNELNQESDNKKPRLN